MNPIAFNMSRHLLPLALVLSMVSGPIYADATEPQMETDLTQAAVKENDDIGVDPKRASLAKDGVRGSDIVVSKIPIHPIRKSLKTIQHQQGAIVQRQTMREGAMHSQAQQQESAGKPMIPSGMTQAASGGYVKTFESISNTGWAPPDAVLAVGPKHILTAVNSGFAIYDKSGGTKKAYTKFKDFMHKPAGWSGSMFDPRAMYDPWHKKFVMLILGKDDTNQKSYYWIAVSKTSDPTGSWWRWRWDATRTSGGTTSWLDFAGLGADKWGVYVTGNYFTFAKDFKGSYLKTINPGIFSGGSTNGWSWTKLKWPGGSHAFSIQPAAPHSGSSQGISYFVNIFSGSGNKVLLWKLTGNRGTGGSAPSLSKVSIGTKNYYGIGQNVDQPGTTNDIDGGGARIINAVYAQKRLYYAITTDKDDDGQRSGWITTKLNTSTNSKEWDHLLYGPKGWYWFYPGITIQGGGSKPKIAVFGSFTGPKYHAGGLFKIYDNHPSSSSGPFRILVSGKGPYTGDRWGDYLDAQYDWSTGHAWGIVQRAGTSTSSWHTHIAGRKFK